MRSRGVIWSLLALFVGLAGGQTAVQSGANCFPRDSLVWKSTTGKALLNNVQFHFKGEPVLASGTSLLLLRVSET